MVGHFFLFKIKIFVLKKIRDWLLTFRFMNASTWLDQKLTLRLMSASFLSFSAWFCCPAKVRRWNLIAARAMLKPVYFTFVNTMLEFFANYTFCYITSTFAKTNKQNNRDDSFETHHFVEGRPCGGPLCTSLVQRSHMLMQKRPPFQQSKKNLNITDLIRLYSQLSLRRTPLGPAQPVHLREMSVL